MFDVNGGSAYSGVKARNGDRSGVLLVWCEESRTFHGKGTGSSRSEVLSLVPRFVFKAGCKTEDQSSVRNRLCMSPIVWVCASLLMGFRFPSYGI
ncbi:unnamed protein product [Brassica napus]|uniref:(rape) hypothetical protein n=1 Tax=Brassica napus TaxID=3708 RepID=A0A816RND0_BRANA|nr:unnamed protein product [Brassica napus]